jgi:hypothetical protein
VQDSVVPGAAAASTAIVSSKFAASPLVTVTLEGVHDSDRSGAQLLATGCKVTGRFSRPLRIAEATSAGALLATRLPPVAEVIAVA